MQIHHEEVREHIGHALQGIRQQKHHEKTIPLGDLSQGYSTRGKQPQHGTDRLTKIGFIQVGVILRPFDSIDPELEVEDFPCKEEGTQ